MHDIAIVGGGPGGLYAAARLARRGLDVMVFEEHQAAGEPVHCTGVLAAEAFDEFDLPPHAILNPLRTAQFFSPSGSSIEYSTPKVEAVVVDRRVFDETLCVQAAQAGARVRAGVRVADVQVTDRAVIVSPAGEQPIEARACVLACGASYVLQRRLGLGMPAAHLQSAQIEVPAARPGHVEVHFGAQLAPRGFAWVVPVQRGDRSFARIGLMCESDAREHFERFFVRTAERWDTVTAGCIPRSKLLPLAPIGKTYTTRLVAVGDAAGIVKATTGGGIYYSLMSSRIAADVLADACHADDFGEEALSAYETRWRALVGDEIAAQSSLRHLTDQLPDEGIEELFELARTDGIMPIVRRTATFNRHRDLILSLLSHPPARAVLMRRVFRLGWLS